MEKVKDHYLLLDNRMASHSSERKGKSEVRDSMGTQVVHGWPRFDPEHHRWPSSSTRNDPFVQAESQVNPEHCWVWALAKPKTKQKIFGEKRCQIKEPAEAFSPNQSIFFHFSKNTEIRTPVLLFSVQSKVELITKLWNILGFWAKPTYFPALISGTSWATLTFQRWRN